MKNVALFVGNDIFSWLVCQDLIATLKGECAFTVYFPLAKSAGRTQEPAVRRLGLYEREVLNDFVFPFVGRNAAACEGPISRRPCSWPPPGSKRIAFSTSMTPRLSAAWGIWMG
ncbi:hypothetical protein ACSJL1_004520 [Serratia sarumanii]